MELPQFQHARRPHHKNPLAMTSHMKFQMNWPFFARFVTPVRRFIMSFRSYLWMNSVRWVYKLERLIIMTSIFGRLSCGKEYSHVMLLKWMAIDDELNGLWTEVRNKERYNNKRFQTFTECYSPDFSRIVGRSLIQSFGDCKATNHFVFNCNNSTIRLKISQLHESCW